jgi:hypothetical protein
MAVGAARGCQVGSAGLKVCCWVTLYGDDACEAKAQSALFGDIHRG